MFLEKMTSKLTVLKNQLIKYAVLIALIAKIIISKNLPELYEFYNPGASYLVCRCLLDFCE